MKTLQGFCIAFGSSPKPSAHLTKIGRMRVFKFLVVEENLHRLTCFKRRSFITKSHIANQVNSRISAFEFREYVGAILERDPETCWPFGSVCEFKDLDTQDMAPDSQLTESLSLISLKIAEDTNAPELPEIQNSKGKEVESEAPTAFEVEFSEDNEAGSKTVAAFELEWTKENNTGSEIATATALLEISKGNKTQLETATAFELEIPKGNKTRSEDDSAFELESTMGINTGYETDTAMEIITSKELNDGRDGYISDVDTELVNLSESENEKSVNGGTKTEISVIADDANSVKTSKRPKKRKFRLLSEILRDLAGPNVKSTVHFADKVDENTDKSDEDFTIDDEDDSDDDTLGMFLKKRKAVKITSRSSGSRNYKKKKTCAPKPLNRGPKGSKARTKRAKPHPHDSFATRKLADAIDEVEAEVALAAKRKRCGSYDMRGGTGLSVVCQPVVGVGGSKDPGPGRGVVAGAPGKRCTLVCVINSNPADFTIIGHGNEYMKRF